MRFLSILAKTFALATVLWYPWLALGLWLAGAWADLRVARPTADQAGLGCRWGWLARWQLAALVLGGAAVAVADYAALRWKDGIPVFASLIAGGLKLLGVSVGSNGGVVCLTTMAGPLEFAASIDGMGLLVPCVFLVLCAAWFGCVETSLGESLRKLGCIAGLLLVVAVVRMGCVVMLANGLFDFVSYESEELPWRPFMEETAIRWVYLPLLLAAGVLLGRFLKPSEKVPSEVPRWLRWMPALSREPRWMKWAELLAFVVLAGLICWEPVGTPKTGKLVISTYHTQWSTSKRPYDREWYGADSGYNYGVLKRFFELFYEVSDAAGPLTEKDLAGASTLVIYLPDLKFSKAELNVVREFVHGGGGLWVIGDHTNVFGSASHLNELCEPFGFRYRDDVLFDLDDDFHQMIDPPKQPSSLWHGLTFFKLRGPTSIQPTSIWTRSAYEVAHSKGVRAIYSVNNFYPPPHDDPKMRMGTFCTCATAHYGAGRVAAWADSTVFSNFEIFYPGKYELALNTMHWLNHRDGMLPTVGREIAAWLLVAGVAAFLLWRREPRVWLATAVAVVGALAVAHYVSGLADRARATFPKPIRPSEWVVFGAVAKDKGHPLRLLSPEAPYDQLYTVFIQWVLRTGAYAGFQLLDPKSDNGLYEHLRKSDNTTTALALIVRKPEDLVPRQHDDDDPALSAPAELNQLEALAEVAKPRPKDPLLLMFASSIQAKDAVAALQKSGLVTSTDTLAKLTTAWPKGVVEIQDGPRRIVVVAGAERFSDQAMGVSEKVTPDAGQRALFGQAFEVIDRLFGRAAPAAK